MIYFYDSQEPVTLQDGEPEPDGMIVRGKIEDFDGSKPVPSDLELVIEVSDSSLSTDRGVKLRNYARARINCYWILNLIDKQVEVYKDVDAETDVPSFKNCQISKPADLVPLHLDGRAIAMISVDSLLPAT